MFAINDNFVRNAFVDKYRDVTNANTRIAEMVLEKKSAILSNTITDIEFLFSPLAEAYLTGDLSTFENSMLAIYDQTFAKDIDIFFFVSADGTFFFDASSPFYDTTKIKNYIIANKRFLLNENMIIQSESNEGPLAALTGAAEAINTKTGELAGIVYTGIIMNNSTDIISSIIKSAKLSEAAIIMGDQIIAGSTTKKNELIIESCYNQQKIQITDAEFYACTDINLKSGGMSLKFYQSIPDEFVSKINKQNKRMGYITMFLVMLITGILGYIINHVTIKSLYKLIDYTKIVLTGEVSQAHSSLIYEFNLLAGQIYSVTHELNAAQVFTKNLINSSEAPIAIWDENGNISLFNKAIEKLSGYKGCNVTGKHVSHLYNLFPNVNVPAAQDIDTVSKSAKFESAITHKETGELKYVLWNLTDLFLDGEYKGTLLQGIDITERKEAESKLTLASKVFENTLDGMMITSPSGEIISVNSSFANMTEHKEADILGKNVRLLRSTKHDERFYKNIWDSLFQYGRWSGEIWMTKKSGIDFPTILTISCIRNKEGSITNFVNVMHDITERKQYEQHIEHQANHDSLTGLPNRLSFVAELDKIIENKDENTYLGILFMDIDRFKNLNDTLGHNTGDRVLEIISERIRNMLHQKKHCARFSGDEFGILLVGNSDQSALENRAEQIIKKISEPIIIQGYELFIQISAGICFYPDNGDNSTELIKNSEIAMFQAKQKGRNNIQQFTGGLDSILKERLLMESKLNRAIENNELSIHYQPKICLERETVMGMEALLRWNNPELGFVSPGEFIPLAEETGLILPIGEWVMKQALKDTEYLIDQGYPDLKVAVNLSLRQFLKKDIAKFVKNTLTKSEVQPTNFELEITESIFTEDLNTISAIMNEINELKVTFAIDDFGTGYSSIGYLKKMPIKTLKIDRSYINYVDSDPENERIVSSVILMAKSLGLAVVAEGAETKQQVDLLRDMGCNIIQGYYYGKPMPLEEFIEFLKDWPNRS